MKTHRSVLSTLLALVIVSTCVTALGAQERQAQHIFTPMASQKASVSQTFGVTEVSIDYHRPAVNERTVWGQLVPYGQVWRTGANENTVISFSTDVSVEGQALAAGTYGLHTIPGESEWTIIFSKKSEAWGSYTYDEAHDALRVTVKPEAAPHGERMAFTFDDVSNEGVTVALHWAELRVPVKVTADTHTLALESFRTQLEGLAGFFWQGYNQAANYCLQNEINYEEALEWADRSIQTQATFSNLSTKAQLLVKTGKTDEVQALMDRAMPLGSAGDLYGYAQQLRGEGQADRALEVAKLNVERNPETWFAHLSLGQSYSAKGEFDKAKKAIEASHGIAPDNRKGMLEGLVAQLAKGEDING